MIVPLESIPFYVKVPKSGEKKFEVTVGLRKGYDLSARYLIKVKTIFSGPGHIIHKKRKI
jgi:hypothetical protein